MKQISVQVPDHIAEAVAKLSTKVGKSQSSICAAWIEESLARELKRIDMFKNIDKILDDNER